MTGDDFEFQDRMVDKAISPDDTPDVVRAKVLEAIRGIPHRDETMPRPDSSFTLRSTEGTWKTVAPGARMKRLKRDARLLSVLLDMEPHAVIDAHDHEGGEDSYVIRGSCRIGALGVSSGDFHHTDAGTHHGDVIASDQGCLLLITVELPDVS